MMNFLLNAEAGGLDLGERFLTGGGVLLRGILTVFAVLGIIWFFLSIVRIVLERVTGTDERKDIEENTIAIIQDPSVSAPIAPTTGTDGGELVAVIAAAIAMAETETGHTGFRVVSFQRVNK